MTKLAWADFIVIHCSATRPNADIGAREIRQWHMSKGWSDIGYHFVIRRSGLVEVGRPLSEEGAHVRGFNNRSVGVCLVGGLMPDGSAADLTCPLEFDSFTGEQVKSAHAVVNLLRKIYPKAEVLGHRDLSPDKDKDGKVEKHEWLKTCPGFDARKEFAC